MKQFIIGFHIYYYIYLIRVIYLSMKPLLIFFSFFQTLETEKSQLASEKQVLMEEQEEMQKNLKSSELLGSKKLDELEGTLSNMSSALLARNEEISTLRQEIESKNLDLLNRESCISTLTDSKTQDEESFVKLQKELEASKELLRQKDEQIASLDEKIMQVNESLESQILDKLEMEENVEALTSGELLDIIFLYSILTSVSL